MQVLELSKAGSSLESEIYAKQQKIGRLVIGRGSLYWYGRKRQKSKRISWSRFAEMMDELAPLISTSSHLSSQSPLPSSEILYNPFHSRYLLDGQDHYRF